MKIHENLVQGSDAWHQLRDTHFTASEAPSMLGESKYKGRTALMNEKKGVKEKVSDHLQRLFDKGHETEDKARSLLEFETAESFVPIVATLEIEGLPLLASLDGISEDHQTIFEHKLWNETLAENVRNQVLEPTYYWQLEQQLLVTGAERALFMVSDGTGVNREMMYYTSQPERRSKLIAGWHEFKKDFESHEVKAKKEVVVAQTQEDLPIITCEVKGTEVVTNLGEYLPLIRKSVKDRLAVVLESDQDFADAEAFVKKLKTARDGLKSKQQEVTDKFESYSLFVNQVAETDSVLQKAHSQLDKAVKQNKETKKQAIINNAVAELNKFCGELAKTINGIQTLVFVEIPDFAAAVKGKRNFSSMESAVEDLLAKSKLGQQEIANLIRANLDTLEELAKDHRFLFNDWEQIIVKDNTDFVNLVKARISEHEEAEAERKRQEQERIEQEAKEKAEREAQAKLEAEEKRIRDEERAKVEAEQKAKQEEVVEQVQDNESFEPNLVGQGEVLTNINEEDIVECKIPHDCLHDIVEWAGENDVSVEAVQELEVILNKYF